MRRGSAVFIGALALALTAVAGWAAIPGETPFPSPTIENVFVSSRTVTAASSPAGPGVLTNYYARGSTVVFQVFAGAMKTGKILTAADVKYAYIKLPDGTKIKLTYKEPANTTDPAWSGRGRSRPPMRRRSSTSSSGSRRRTSSTATSSRSPSRPRNSR